jgi:hypothetical protein
MELVIKVLVLGFREFSNGRGRVHGEIFYEQRLVLNDEYESLSFPVLKCRASVGLGDVKGSAKRRNGRV